MTIALQCVVQTGPAGPIASHFGAIFFGIYLGIRMCLKIGLKSEANGCAGPNHALKCDGHGKHGADPCPNRKAWIDSSAIGSSICPQ